ncbi:ABC transporter substrate-binding protein [Bordetella genomosp. 4]|uniref:ABC transporter substrate-binding protein n=1 Tax=Bordetella genomosp. 4 TaxID=463044 RepID=A0A261USB5_9BORD|nr:ABC transporter substrate-binding protein [Bordetella genomosp. 4]OZI53300.1 ABC transporter substrate-binding protein [Bordetella genomosp. 4]OZI64779.1 ABC transporter substrate-binding protein [Bordetella genomosp. 4]
MTIDPNVVSSFTPTGRLRASINLGNPILANRNAAGEPVGVSVDLAGAFARSLGVELELVVLDSAGKSVDTVTEDRADIGFFAIDPKRAAGICFTDAYVLIEGAYLVRDDSPLRHMDEVDRAGHRVTVGQGSAYDLFLSRELKHASITRAATSPTVVATFLADGTEVAAGVKQQLESDARHYGGLRLLEGSFMTIRQAMGLPRGRGEDAAKVLASFVEEMKRSGFVEDALKRHGIQGAAVAPTAALA